MMGEGIHSFPKGINPKVSVIVQLKSKLANYNVAIQHVIYCTTGTPSPIFKYNILKKKKNLPRPGVFKRVHDGK